MRSSQASRTAASSSTVASVSRSAKQWKQRNQAAVSIMTFSCCLRVEAHRRLGYPAGEQSVPRVQPAAQPAARTNRIGPYSQFAARSDASGSTPWCEERRAGAVTRRTSLSRLKRATFSARSVAGSAGSVRSRVARSSACGAESRRQQAARAGGCSLTTGGGRRAPGRDRTRRTGPERTPARGAPLHDPPEAASVSGCTSAARAARRSCAPATSGPRSSTRDWVSSCAAEARDARVSACARRGAVAGGARAALRVVRACARLGQVEGHQQVLQVTCSYIICRLVAGKQR